MIGDFLRIQDNGDGTCTLNLKFGPEEEQCFIISMSFDGIVNSFPVPEELAQAAADTMTEIPNTIEGAEH